MECSVSSLERFAGCAYAHFLRYGLGLQERETGEIDPSDLGNISHKTLELFGKYCRENHEDFALISLKKTEEIIDVLTEQLLSSYRDGIFKEEAGSEFMEKQVRRILKRSVTVLKNQLSKGDFVPASYEQEFKRLLSDPGALLVGKIDRVDTFTGEDTAYVKIVDYKTGSKDFEEELFHAGVQLQTAVYLSEAVKKYATDHPDKTVKPGAMFYCRMQDPFFESYDESEEKRESERNIALRPTGLLSGDEATLGHLEREHKDGKSEVIPATYKDGAANGKTGNRAVKNEEEMQKILAEADEKVESLAKEILSGKIDVSPLVCGDSYNACEYCAFRSSCGFDARLPGYAVRKGAGGTEETKSEDE
ncbi:MAG: PD-(D/E)XK nuclease family protein [Lachnospiraceae bacterium]|nr:PD-(D/E)XK nuclease family protein [Lachnospiraceae bacterium]